MSIPVEPTKDDEFTVDEPAVKKRRWLRWLAGVLLVGAILVFVVPPLIAWFLYQNVTGGTDSALPEGTSVESIQEELNDSEIFNPTTPDAEGSDTDRGETGTDGGGTGDSTSGADTNSPGDEIVDPGNITLPSASPGSSVEQVREQIVEKAQRNIPSVVQEPAAVLSATEQVCANIDAGWGPVELATRTDLPVEGWEDRAKFLALAVGMECPEHNEQAMGWYEQFQKVRSLAG